MKNKRKCWREKRKTEKDRNRKAKKKKGKHEKREKGGKKKMRKLGRRKIDFKNYNPPEIDL